jgi:hypothetical protein
MTHEPISIVLIANNDADLEFFRKSLEAFEFVQVKEFLSLNDFRENCGNDLYSGFLVDIRTLIRSSSSEKRFFAMLLEVFPVMRVTRKPGTGDFSGLVESKDLGKYRGQALLDAFIQDWCLLNPPREIRVSSRNTIYLSGMISFGDEFSQDQSARVTIENISDGGCFVVTNHDGINHDKLWLVITELRDQTPIECHVKWRKPWGVTTRYLPGIGVAFGGLSKMQYKELTAIMR